MGMNPILEFTFQELVLVPLGLGLMYFFCCCRKLIQKVFVDPNQIANVLFAWLPKTKFNFD